ncbi:LVIVD repeat-containing protein [Vibrio ostreicida]|uniref:LVIVD repeat-containing protein n=1 Tax=Vibrio ostreicida TaxID=526588 RepID=UPI003B5C93E2
MFKGSFGRISLLLTTILVGNSYAASPWDISQNTPVDIEDNEVKKQVSLSPDRAPMPPALDSYGMQSDGSFQHPTAAPESHQPHPFSGQMSDWDTNSYIKNMRVEAYYPIQVEPFHTWQNIIDFDGKRYLYQYVRSDLKIFDITDPKAATLLLTKGHTWGKSGSGEPQNPFAEGEMMGAASIQWSDHQQSYVMVQAYEVRRFGLLKDKYRQPDKVKAIRQSPHLKGFKVYAMKGPLPKDWTLLAERTTDILHPDAPIGQQQGSGVRDIPTYNGDGIMYVAAAPDKRYGLTEYPNDLYSAGYQAWDMSDPTNPRLLDVLSVPGQIIGDAEHEAVYKADARAGNRTSWMGARMSLFLHDKQADYGYAAMGGLGFYVIDVRDPSNMKVVGNLKFPPNIAGTEGDFVDVSQVKESGLVYYSGYPLNEDCYEPYKDIHIIDVSDPKNPISKGVMPRPTPPESAKFTDFCQRRGSFGPKRTGAYHQPGIARKDLLPYNFYNAGLQVFDVSDPNKPHIAAYFVPPFAPDKVASYAMGNLSHSVYVEYDRNLFWLFTNHGFYALSSPLLGEPKFSAPQRPWPPKTAKN